MKKRILACCLLITISAIAVYASRSRSTGRTRSPNIVKLLVTRIEKLEKQVTELKERVWSLEIQLRPELKLKKDGKAQRIRGPLKIGQIVYFDGDDKLMVQQIVDERNILAELRIRQLSGNTLVAIQEPVFIKGISTSGLVDDKLITLPSDMLFKITKTKTYETVMGGTKTVFMLERISVDK